MPERLRVWGRHELNPKILELLENRLSLESRTGTEKTTITRVVAYFTSDERDQQNLTETDYDPELQGDPSDDR